MGRRVPSFCPRHALSGGTREPVQSPLPSSSSDAPGKDVLAVGGQHWHPKGEMSGRTRAPGGGQRAGCGVPETVRGAGGAYEALQGGWL